MPIVANSSPLILYARVGRLDLLRALYHELLIPPGVHREVVEQGANRPGVADIASAAWIRIRVLLSPVPVMARSLGAGESEAIALAREMGLQAILDDQSGRSVAVRLGVSVTGSAGVLVAAKRRGLISAVGPPLDALRRAGLRLDERLYQHVLEDAGEAPP